MRDEWKSAPHSMPADELAWHERTADCQCGPNREWVCAVDEDAWPRLVIRHYSAAEVAARGAMEVPF